MTPSGKSFVDDLRKYFEDDGTVRTFPEGHPLLRKSSKQRVLYKKDKCLSERIETLESIGETGLEATQCSVRAVR